MTDLVPPDQDEQCFYCKVGVTHTEQQHEASLVDEKRREGALAHSASPTAHNKHVDNPSSRKEHHVDEQRYTTDYLVIKAINLTKLAEKLTQLSSESWGIAVQKTTKIDERYEALVKRTLIRESNDPLQG